MPREPLQKSNKLLGSSDLCSPLERAQGRWTGGRKKRAEDGGGGDRRKSYRTCTQSCYSLLVWSTLNVDRVAFYGYYLLEEAYINFTRGT